MKKAIVTGATGYIGSAVVEKLLSENIDVLAIGRREWSKKEQHRCASTQNFKYIKLDMSKISTLPKILHDICWEPGENCVFYHFAWSGANKLVDGTVDEQMRNVNYSVKAVEVAKELGCSKFVNVGSQEEVYIEEYLRSDWKNSSYYSDMATYASAKLAARNMCQLIAYLSKIDYVHSRVSVVANQEFNSKGYVCSTIKNILNGQEYESPKNKQLFEIVPMKELVIAYYLIGLNGKNKADYFIGTGMPMSLSKYFNIVRLKNKNNDLENTCDKNNDDVRCYEKYSIENLKRDTGYVPILSFYDLLNSCTER